MGAGRKKDDDDAKDEKEKTKSEMTSQVAIRSQLVDEEQYTFRNIGVATVLPSALQLQAQPQLLP